MSIVEIEMARSYLARSDQDPVAALIRSVRDLAKLRRLLAGANGDVGPGPAAGRAGPRNAGVQAGAGRA